MNRAHRKNQVIIWRGHNLLCPYNRGVTSKSKIIIKLFTVQVYILCF